ncbi:MAG: hypothetical protein R3Y45_03695 [Bacillota bacterium]
MKGKENKLFLIMLALVLAFALLLTGAEVVFAETAADTEAIEYVAVDIDGGGLPLPLLTALSRVKIGLS